MTTILVAEDHRVNQRIIAFTLRKAGYGVVTAPNGCEALEQMQNNAIDLVIADIEMPKMNGITLVKQLRANKLHQKIPIIILTASGQNEDHVKAISVGANDVLTKPSSSQELINTIIRMLNEPLQFKNYLESI